jgi:hypothetical protein
MALEGAEREERWRKPVMAKSLAKNFFAKMAKNR